MKRWTSFIDGYAGLDAASKLAVQSSLEPLLVAMLASGGMRESRPPSRRHMSEASEAQAVKSHFDEACEYGAREVFSPPRAGAGAGGAASSSLPPGPALGTSLRRVDRGDATGNLSVFARDIHETDGAIEVSSAASAGAGKRRSRKTKLVGITSVRRIEVVLDQNGVPFTMTTLYRPGDVGYGDAKKLAEACKEARARRFGGVRA